jgi:hypothetical protein
VYALITTRQGLARLTASVALGLVLFSVVSLVIDSPFHSERYEFRGVLKQIAAAGWVLSAVSLALSRKSYIAWVLFVIGALTLGYGMLR